jgi:hypothetical protein
MNNNLDTSYGRNLVTGPQSPLNWETPGFPNFQDLVNVASAEVTSSQPTSSQPTSSQPTSSQPTSSHYILPSNLSILPCSFNQNCPGNTVCQVGRCLPMKITNPVLQNGVISYSENYSGCGTAAEGKLNEITKKYKNKKF